MLCKCFLFSCRHLIHLTLCVEELVMLMIWYRPPFQLILTINRSISDDWINAHLPPLCAFSFPSSLPISTTTTECSSQMYLHDEGKVCTATGRVELDWKAYSGMLWLWRSGLPFVTTNILIVRAYATKLIGIEEETPSHFGERTSFEHP